MINWALPSLSCAPVRDFAHNRQQRGKGGNSVLLLLHRRHVVWHLSHQHCTGAPALRLEPLQTEWRSRDSSPLWTVYSHLEFSIALGRIRHVTFTKCLSRKRGIIAMNIHLGKLLHRTYSTYLCIYAEFQLVYFSAVWRRGCWADDSRERNPIVNKDELRQEWCRLFFLFLKTSWFWKWVASVIGGTDTTVQILPLYIWILLCLIIGLLSPK